MQIKALVSFPCSGRTWLLAMLAGATDKDLKKWMENVEFVIDDSVTLLASHLYENAFFRDSDFPWGAVPMPMTILTRNPWDTMVSYWKHMVHRGYYGDGNPEGTLDRFMPEDASLSAFLRDPRFGVQAWDDWHNFAMTQLKDGDMLMTYRHLQESPEKALRTFTTWLKYDYPWDIESGVAYGDVDFMRSHESEIPHLRPTSDNPDSGKVRKARVGGFLEYMSDKDIKYVCDNISDRWMEIHGEVLKGDKVWQ